MAGVMTIHALLRQHRVRQSRILIHVGLRVDTTTEIKLIPTQSQAGVRSIDSSSIWEDMREGTLRTEFAISLGEVFTRCEVNGGIGGVEERAGRTSLTSSLTEELAGNMLCIWEWLVTDIQ